MAKMVKIIFRTKGSGKMLCGLFKIIPISEQKLNRRKHAYEIYN